MLDKIALLAKPYLAWIVWGGIALVVGAFTWMTVDLALTKSALANSRGELRAANMIVEGQQRAIEALDRVDRLEQNLNRLVVANRDRIMQAQGANDEIPPEVAAAFIANSDSVLAYRGNPRAVEELHVPR